MEPENSDLGCETLLVRPPKGHLFRKFHYRYRVLGLFDCLIIIIIISSFVFPPFTWGQKGNCAIHSEPGVPGLSGPIHSGSGLRFVRQYGVCKGTSF